MLQINKQNGFILTKEGKQELKLNKSSYDKLIKADVKSLCKFNEFDNFVFPNIKRRLNGRESDVLKEQLTLLIAKTFTTWYPNNTARAIFRVNSQNAPGVQSLKYSMKDWYGKAKVVTDENTDMPLVGGSKKTKYSPVFELQLGAKFTLNDLEAAALGTQPLEKDKIEQCRKGHERAFNDLAFGIAHLGKDPDKNAENVPGLFNQLDRLITESDSDNLEDYDILAGTAQDNKNYLIKVINTPYEFTEQNESIANVLVMPIAQVNVIMSQTLSNDNNVTVAKFILDNTSIEKIIACPECKNVGVNSIKDALFVYNDSEASDIAQVEETLPYKPYPTELNSFNYLIPTRSRNAGLFIFKKAIAFVKNCGKP